MKTKTIAFLALGILVLISAVQSNPVWAQSMIQPLNHRVIDAEFSKELNSIITVSTTPKNQLHIYDPVAKRDTGIYLPYAPTCVSVSPDGQYAAVGHDGYLSYVRLTGLSTVLKTIPLDCNVYEVVLAGNGYAYAFPYEKYGLGNIQCIHLESAQVTVGTGRFDGKSRAKLHPDGKTIYGVTGRTAPEDIKKCNIANGTATVLYDSPYHGDFPMGDDLWLSQDGTRVFTGCGTVFSSSDVKSEDMIYNGSFPEISRVTHMDHSQTANKIVAIPNRLTGSFEECNPEVWVYDSDYLNIINKRKLPKFQVRGTAFLSRGKFAFYDKDGSDYFVIVQADASSGMALDYGVIAYATAKDSVAHTINTSSGTGGKIVPSGPITVNHGSSQIVALSPRYGYEIVDVKVDGISIGKASSYEFDNVVKDHTIAATFAACATCAENPLKLMNHKVTDAEYSKALDQVVTISQSPENQLHLYSPATQEDVAIDLPLSPTCLSLAPDGLHAAVGHDGWISYVDLAAPALLKTLPVSCPVFDIVLAGNGYVYAFPLGEQEEIVRCIHLETGLETPGTGSMRAGLRAKLHPGGVAIYAIDTQRSPSKVDKFSISSGIARLLYESPYSSEYEKGSDLWLSEDGLKIFSQSGNVFRTSDVKSEDITYVGSLGNISPIVHLDQATSTNKVLAILSDHDSEAWVYDNDDLGLQNKVQLPGFRLKDTDYPAHGRFAFSSANGENYYVLAQADASSKLPVDYGIVTIPAAMQAQYFTITASAGTGGHISPPGKSFIYNTESLTYSITPDRGYRLLSVIVDGVAISNPSTSYTFDYVTSDHTIKVAFTRDYDYFGVQEGNVQSAVATQNGTTVTASETITLDYVTTPPSYLIYQIIGTSTASAWYTKQADSLRLSKVQDYQATLVYSQPLVVVKNPMTAGMTWSSTSTVQIPGVATGTAKLTAAVSPKVLVTVPAGTFLAFPVAYTETVSGQGGTNSVSWTEYFVPYIGSVKVVNPSYGLEVTGFATACGTVNRPPPVISSVTPSSGTPGTTITITGYQLAFFQGTGELKIGSTRVENIPSWTDTVIQCVVPAGATTGGVVVTTEAWSSNSEVVFTVR